MRVPPTYSRFIPLLTVLGLRLFAPVPLPAQGSPTIPGTGTVRGVVNSARGLPIGGAQVRFVVPGRGVTTSVESDDEGSFTAVGVPKGAGWVVARRIGYRPDSVRVDVTDDEPARATVRLDRIAVELSTVQVFGRRDVTGVMAGFYRRMGYGNGRFFTASDIDRRNTSRMTDVFRLVPGLRIETRGFQNSVRMRGSRCAPLVWLDAQPLFSGEVDLDAFDPRSFEGIEVYSGAASVPVEFQGNQRMSSACGTIVLWSKRGELRERKRKKDEPSPSMRIARMIDEGEAFVATDVDAAARPDSFNLIRPIYPDSLFDAETPGTVLAEFVVSANGEANMDTFSAITSSNRLFVEPVRRAVREQRFTPAVRKGRIVPQVMQLPFEFVPDSTARRRK
ncbi:carboxypeptidase regulatory-like domain-containing protein [Gemmatimonas sp.]